MFKTNINWLEELPEIKRLGKMGYTQTALAKKYIVSRQRMKQIVDRFIPDWNENYGQAVNRQIALDNHFKKWGTKEESDIYRSQRLKFNHKKANATRVGWEWDLDFGDLEWPTHCPILGLELDYFAESRKEESPSFDKLDPSKGYVRGNVRVMSWRANRIKNNGTAEEHRKIAEYLDKLNTDTLA